MLDLQKASVFKRLGAYLLDLILLATLAVGAWAMFSPAVGYNEYAVKLKGYYEKYEQEYDIDFDISSEEYEALSEEELKKYTDANEAMNQDEEALYVYNMKVYLEIMLASSSILLAYTVLEIVVPLILKNGQTVGKKVFGLCVMHKEGVRVSAIQMCFRTLLGKYTLETMPFVLWFILTAYQALGIVVGFVISLLAMAQAIILIFSRANCAIHDKLCNTVVVDYHSQMIFDCVEDLIEYKEALAAEEAENAEY